MTRGVRASNFQQGEVWEEERGMAGVGRRLMKGAGGRTWVGLKFAASDLHYCPE